MTSSPRTSYKATFAQADEDGDYVDMGRSYTIAIDTEHLTLAKERIPWLKVLKVERVGNGVAITYFDARKIPTKVMLTTSNIFGIAIGRAKKLDELVAVLEEAVNSALGGTPSEAIAEAREMAPPDTCHDCGQRGGVRLGFGKIWSAVLLSRWSSTTGVYCKRHATIRGLRATLVSGAIGWWSPWGAFIAPVYLVRNIRSLWRHSNIPKLLIGVLAVLAFLPVVAIVRIVRSW